MSDACHLLTDMVARLKRSRGKMGLERDQAGRRVGVQGRSGEGPYSNRSLSVAKPWEDLPSQVGSSPCLRLGRASFHWGRGLVHPPPTVVHPRDIRSAPLLSRSGICRALREVRQDRYSCRHRNMSFEPSHTTNGQIQTDGFTYSKTMIVPERPPSEVPSWNDYGLYDWKWTS